MKQQNFMSTPMGVTLACNPSKSNGGKKTSKPASKPQTKKGTKRGK